MKTGRQFFVRVVTCLLFFSQLPAQASAMHARVTTDGSISFAMPQSARAEYSQFYTPKKGDVLFDLGRMQTEMDLWSIFGAPDVYAGSDQPARLEEALIANRTTRFVFLGRARTEIQRSLFGKIWSMMNPSVFTSRRGQSYDLSKISFLIELDPTLNLFKQITLAKLSGSAPALREQGLYKFIHFTHPEFVIECQRLLYR